VLGKVRIVGLWLAVPYLVWILVLLLTPGEGPVEGLNLEPLATLSRQYRFLDSDVFLLQVVGNVGLLLPFGALAVVWDRPLRKTLAYILIGSIVIELMQYTPFVSRVADVDDVILNVVGGLVGWLLGWPLVRTLSRADNEN
jgi:glycopeptide antibiotics resistance protein